MPRVDSPAWQTQSDRRVPAVADDEQGADAVADGRSAHAHPPRLSRSCSACRRRRKRSTAFVNDASPDAWPKLVDRLLASPHYGERWARHWLDLVRYADSGGFEFDVDRPEAWRYRDYVVKSFNNDKPYVQFVREQIAGDEYAPGDRRGDDRDRLPAARARRRRRRRARPAGRARRRRRDDVADVHGHDGRAARAATTTSSIRFRRRTTTASRRCSSRRAAVEHPLVPAHEVEAQSRGDARASTALQQAAAAGEEATIEAPYLKQLVDREIALLPEYLQIAWKTPADERTEGQRLNVAQIEKTLQNDTLRAKITEKDIVALMPADVKAKHAALERADRGARQAEAASRSPTARGDRRTRPRAAAVVLPASRQHRRQGIADDAGRALGRDRGRVRRSRRRRPTRSRAGAGADSPNGWSSPDNPLTARVMVNRIWQHHFGEGIVRTPSNFGKMGEPPSHPELLDWLARRVRRARLEHEGDAPADADVAGLPDGEHATSPANVAIDPENRLFWRMPRQRLEAEIIRDQMLAVAGTLDRTLGGPNVFPYIDPDLFEESSKRDWPGKPDDDPSTWRRSLYVFSKRSIRYPMFETFDQPNLVNSVDRRNRSTIAPQALILMNNALVLLQAKKFAERLQREAGDRRRRRRSSARSSWRWRGRPTPSSCKESVAFVSAGPTGLAEFCHVLFNLNEFVYRPMSRHDRPSHRPHVHDCGTSRSCCTRAASCSAGSAAASPAWRSPTCSASSGLLGRRERAGARIRSRRSRSTFPAKAKAVISIFCYGGVSQVDTFDPKPDLLKYQGETMQGVGEVRTIDGHARRPDAVAVDVQEARPVRDGRLGAVPARRRARRRHRADPLDALAEPGARPGAVPDEHRQHPRRASERRQLGHLRPRQREREPARASSSSPIIAAGRSTGRRTGATATCRRRIRACSSATPATPIVDLKPPVDRTPDEQREWLRLLHELNEKHASTESARTPSCRRASTRTSSRSACRRTRPTRSTSARKPTATQTALRRRRGADRLLRPAGADGAAAGRARRPLRADLLRRRQLRAELGRALGSQGEPRPALRRDRQADRRADQGPEEPRACSTRR